MREAKDTGGKLRLQMSLLWTQYRLTHIHYYQSCELYKSENINRNTSLVNLKPQLRSPTKSFDTEKKKKEMIKIHYKWWYRGLNMYSCQW